MAIRVAAAWGIPIRNLQRADHFSAVYEYLTRARG